MRSPPVISLIKDAAAVFGRPREANSSQQGDVVRVDRVLALCEHRAVNVISSATIKRYAALHADAAGELFQWHKAASRSVWRDLNDVRRIFPDADQYKSLLVFNIRHNHYRLIVKVDYRARLMLVKEFLTHDEYMRGGWKKWAR